MISPLLFTSAFMFVVCLLLIGVIYSQLYWLIKAALVTISLAFCGFVYMAFSASLGFPTPATPRVDLPYVASVVREPSPINNDPGAIYVWLMVEGVPRAIVVPFSSQNRHIVAEADAQIERGAATMMLIKQRSKRDGDSDVPYFVTGEPILEISQPEDTLPKKH